MGQNFGFIPFVVLSNRKATSTRFIRFRNRGGLPLLFATRSSFFVKLVIPEYDINELYNVVSCTNVSILL